MDADAAPELLSALGDMISLWYRVGGGAAFTLSGNLLVVDLKAELGVDTVAPMVDRGEYAVLGGAMTFGSVNLGDVDAKDEDLVCQERLGVVMLDRSRLISGIFILLVLLLLLLLVALGEVFELLDDDLDWCEPVGLGVAVGFFFLFCCCCCCCFLSDPFMDESSSSFSGVLGVLCMGGNCTVSCSSSSARDVAGGDDVSMGPSST